MQPNASEWCLASACFYSTHSKVGSLYTYLIQQYGNMRFHHGMGWGGRMWEWRHGYLLMTHNNSPRNSRSEEARWGRRSAFSSSPATLGTPSSNGIPSSSRKAQPPFYMRSIALGVRIWREKPSPLYRNGTIRHNKQQNSSVPLDSCGDACLRAVVPSQYCSRHESYD